MARLMIREIFHKMIAKLALVAVVLAASEAVWLGNPYEHLFLRNAQPPSIAYGFGGGFSSNVGGISHSSGYGTSFRTGDAQAYGAGYGSTGGNVARGVGFAQTTPQWNHYNHFPQLHSGFGKNFVSAIAQTFGKFGSAVSAVQTNDGLGSAISSVQNNGRFQSAVSSVQNLGRSFSLARNQPGFILSRADNAGDIQTAISSTHGSNGQATAIVQNIGGYKASIANNVQLGRDVTHNNGASVINGPGFQSAQSHAINTGYN